MAGAYDHLPLPRIETTTARRTGGRFPPGPRPEPREHARALRERLARAVADGQAAEPGFDGRGLLRITLDGKPPDDLARQLPGAELVADEGKDAHGHRIVVVFTTKAARDEFEKRLGMMQRGQKTTHADLLLAVRGIESWTAADRTSPSLSRALADGWEHEFDVEKRLDVELFPLDDDLKKRAEMVEVFTERCKAWGVRVLDKVTQAVVLLRVETKLTGIRWLLRYTDVRTVDLPPRFQLPPELRRQSLSALDVQPASPTAPLVAVLDSGVVANHPLLAQAMAQAESFRTGEGAADEHGHGTGVCGLAVYGDVEACASSGTFRPEVRLLSGRVLGVDNEYDELIENQVRRAVVEFRKYGCRVFNLSLADEEHPYDGRRLRSFAATLDALAREHDVLFVVATGNHGRTGPKDWRREYPEYLLREDARILDPAPALNALTVGSVARHEMTRVAAGHPNDPAYQPLARRGEPSPFTRSGPGLNGATKPELVEHGGNWAIDTRMTASRPHGEHDVGVLTTSKDFAAGNLFSVDAGTSYAAPVVSNLAARIFGARPGASANLVRAMLVAHAEVPEAAARRLSDPSERLRLVGYGVANAARCLGSFDHSVTLLREETIGENETHFYEIPFPADFFDGKPRRRRRVRVVVAHTPMTRATRFEYRASRLKLRIPRSADQDKVIGAYRKTSKDEREDRIPEPASIWPAPTARGAGTVQVATWEIGEVGRRWGKQPRFIVVERIVPSWAEGRVENEPYAIVLVIEERERADVRYYAQIRARVEQRARVRTHG